MANELTRFTVDTPVHADVMNQLCDEIEARDKVIEDKANVLGNDRGYLTTKMIEEGDLNNLKENGKYFVMSNVLNIPHLNEFQGYCEVTSVNNNKDWIKQTFTEDRNDYVCTYERLCSSGVWTDWKEIMTSDNIHFNEIPKFPNNSLIEYVKNLPNAYQGVFQTSNTVTDTPLANYWYYTYVSKHSYGSSEENIYASIFLIPFLKTEQPWVGVLENGVFGGWREIVTSNNLSNYLKTITIVPFFMGGKGGNEGGEVHFSRADNTAWTSDLVMDVYNDALRFYIQDAYGIKVLKINYQKMEHGDLDFATVKLIDNTTLSLLNGFVRLGDTNYGKYSTRVGNLVHINYVLYNNGAGNANVFKLPYPPNYNEIHFCKANGGQILEFRTNGDEYLYLNGTLPNDGGFTSISLTYVCAIYV